MSGKYDLIGYARADEQDEEVFGTSMITRDHTAAEMGSHVDLALSQPKVAYVIVRAIGPVTYESGPASKKPLVVGLFLILTAAIFFFMLGVALTTVVEAADLLVPAKVIKVVDGDTIRVRARPWPTWEINILVRINGIDTPELRGKCPEEKVMARQAKERVKQLIGKDDVTILNPKKGKYAGRIIANVILANGQNLAIVMIREGHARPYLGGKREGWCDG